jgi:hypothetical protein
MAPYSTWCWYPPVRCSALQLRHQHIPPRRTRRPAQGNKALVSRTRRSKRDKEHMRTTEAAGQPIEAGSLARTDHADARARVRCYAYLLKMCGGW